MMRLTIDQYREKYPEQTKGLSDFDLTHQLWLTYGKGQDFYQFSQEFHNVPQTPAAKAALTPPDRSPRPETAVPGNTGLAGDDPVGHLEYLGLKAHAAWDSGWAAFFHGADQAADLIAGDFFGPKSGIFGKTAETLYRKADELDKIAQQHGANAAEEVIAEAAGGAIPGIFEFYLNVPWAALRGAAEANANGDSLAVGAVEQGVKRYVLGRIFNAFGKYGKPAAMAGNAVVFGAETAIEGGDTRDVAKAAATGVLYGLLHKKNVEKGRAETKAELDKMENVKTAEPVTPEEANLANHESLGTIADEPASSPSVSQKGIEVQEGKLPEGWVHDGQYTRKDGSTFEHYTKKNGSKDDPMTGFSVAVDAAKGETLLGKIAAKEATVAENNGSAESAASMEAINRSASEAAAGRTRYSVDTRTGVIKKLPRGVDAVDLIAQPYSVLIQDGVGKGGRPVILDRGAKVVAPEKAVKLVEEFIKKTEPPVVMEQKKAAVKEAVTEVTESVKLDAEQIAAKMGEMFDTEGELKEPFKRNKKFQNLVTEKWDTTDGARVLADEIAANDAKAMQKKTGIKTTLAEVEKEAMHEIETLGIGDPKRLLREASKFYGGVQNVAAKMRAWKLILASHTEKANAMLEKAEGAKGTDLDWAHFLVQFDFISKLQPMVAGAQAHIARATTAARITVSGREIELAHLTPEILDASLEARAKFEEVFQRAGGREAAKRLAADWKKAAKFKDKMKVVRKMRGSKFMNALLEFRATNMLINIKTQIVNLTSNILHLTLDTIDNYAAVALGHFSKGEKMTLQEANLRAYSVFSGILNGYVSDPVKMVMSKDFHNSLKGPKRLSRFERYTENRGVDPYVRATSEGLTPNALSSEYLRSPDASKSTISDISWWLLDRYGQFARSASFGLMNLSDGTIKTITYDTEVRALAFREATRRGVPKKDIGKWIEKQKILVDGYRSGKKLLNVPPENQILVDAIHKQALAKARYIAWQEEMAPGMQKRLEQGLKETPVWRLLVPFYKTPMNLLKQIPRRIPGLHKLSEVVQADIAEGGIKKAQAYGRIVTGTAMLMGAFALYANGSLVGGIPPEERKTFADAGVLEYSIKIPGIGQVQINRYDPFGSFLGMAADLGHLSGRMSDPDFDGFWGALMMMGANNVFSKTWATTAADLALVMKEPKQYGSFFLKRYAGTLLPLEGLPRSVGAYIDPVQRDTMDFVESIKATYYGPAASERFDSFGKPLPNYSPVLGSNRTWPRYDSPARMELAYLHVRGKPRFKDVLGVEVTPAQDRAIMEVLDKELHYEDRMNAIITGGAYPKANGLRKELLTNIRDTFYRAAAMKYFAKDPNMLAQLKLNTQENFARLMKVSPRENPPNWRQFMLGGY